MNLFTKLSVSFSLLIFSSSLINAQKATKFEFGQRNAFVENKGQFKTPAEQTGNILYAFEEGGTRIYFTPKGVIYSFTKVTIKNKSKKEENSVGEDEEEKKAISTQSDVVSMEWEGCNSNCNIVAENKLPDYFNYGTKNNGAYNGISNVNGYEKITYKNLYPGIDVEYVINPKGGVEYSLTVQPGANIMSVKMKYAGKIPMLDKKGNVHISTLFGDIIDHKPTKCLNGENSTSHSFFRLTANNTVSFGVSNYHPEQILVIDPWTITPSFPNSNRVWNCQTDAAGNVYLYGGDMPLLLCKYNSGGTLQWTYTTTWDSTSYWLGTLITDRTGVSYITAGSNGEISKISTGGGLVWHNNPNGFFGPLYEYWHMAFNCDQTQLVVGGMYGASPFNIAGYQGAIFNINLTNGTIANQIAVGYNFGLLNINEVRAMCSAPNGNYYFLTLDSIGSTQSALTSVNYKIPNNYNFSYGSPTYSIVGNLGMNAMRATTSFIYTQNGTNIDKRDINTGNILTTAAIPGGTSSSFLGAYAPGNSGLDIDSCGNVYVGSTNQVIEYDANLNQITTVTTPSAVYDVAVNNNGNVIACGNGFAMSINFSACKPPAPICKTGCTPPGLIGIPTNIKCFGSSTGSATVTPSGGNPPYTYSWSPNVSTTGNASGLSAGSYTCTVTDNTGCSSISLIAVTQPAVITATVTPTATSCGGNTGSASASAAGGTGAYTYSWSPSGGSTNNATGLSAGTYTLTITDANSCSFSVSTNVISSGGPTATPTQSNIKCGGNNTGSATANVTGGTAPYTYAWSPSGGSSATASNLSAGTYTCIVTDNKGCISSFIITITTPAALTLSYKSDTICRGDTVAFTANVSGGTNPYAYAWAPATGLSCNNCPSPMASPTATTCYNVTLTDSNGCSATAHVCMKVNQLPNVTLIKQSADTICNSSGAILLFGSPGGGVFGGKGVTGTFFYPDSVPVNQYDVFFYKYTDGNGCSKIAKDSVYVVLCEGIDNITGNNGIITIYPNPNNGQFIIQSSVISNQLSVEIYDVLGQVVSKKQLKAKSTLIDLGTVANGVYFYRVLKASGNVLGAGKIVIQK